MNIAICDDMKIDRERLKMFLLKLEKEYAIEFDITEFRHPKLLLEQFAAGYKMQIVFMDIYMEDAMGTEAAKYLRDIGYHGSIIFCTTSEDHALTGFRVQADGYLVKPYTYEEFKESLQRIDEMIRREQKHVHFNSERIDYDIPLAEVLMIAAVNKGCEVHLKEERLFTWKRLKDFSLELKNECFYQIGRYSLVNLDAIRVVEDTSVVITDGTVVDMPAREKNKIRQDINDYIWKKMRQ